MSEIPREALELHYNSGGFLPDIGLYRRGDAFYHGPSRSHFWLLASMLLGAVAVAILPWHTKAVVGEVKYWIAGMFLFGGLCDMVPHLLRNACGQHVAIDLKNKTLSIAEGDFSLKVSWQQVLGLQICHQKVPGNSELNGYQLNLVWTDAGGVVGRHCLLKHAVRGFVFRLGRRYESLFDFKLMDHTCPPPIDNVAMSTPGQRIKRCLPQILLIVTFIGFSWLAMQVVHELGHVLVARLTGAEVTKVALHPFIISRTDVAENPHPLAEVWGGPLVGSLLPLLLFGLAAAFRLPGVYLLRFFAGFCLVANGVYIGVGHFLAEGADPWVMMENGSPRWLLVAFGAMAFPFGLYLWHRQGPHFGLGDAKGKVDTRAAIFSAVLFVGLAGAEVVRNVR